MNETKSKYDDNLCASSDFKELSRIRKFVKNNAMAFGFDDPEAQKISLAVDEACSNLIRHAFHFDKSKEICVEIETKSKQFIVKVIDDGKPFDPRKVDEPDMREYFEEYKQGGLGIMIMRKVMDKIQYKPSNKNNSKNVLKLIKNLAM